MFLRTRTTHTIGQYAIVCWACKQLWDFCPFCFAKRSIGQERNKWLLITTLSNSGNLKFASRQCWLCGAVNREFLFHTAKQITSLCGSRLFPHRQSTTAPYYMRSCREHLTTAERRSRRFTGKWHEAIWLVSLVLRTSCFLISLKISHRLETSSPLRKWRWDISHSLDSPSNFCGKRCKI